MYLFYVICNNNPEIRDDNVNVIIDVRMFHRDILLQIYVCISL